MNKRVYQQPTMNVVTLQHQSIICESITTVNGNASLKYGGAGAGDANSRRGGGWDDEE